jgi:HEAT repeat protein
MVLYILMCCFRLKIIIITSLIIMFFAVLPVISPHTAAGAGGTDITGEMKDENSLRALIQLANEPQEDWKMRIKALDTLAASGSPMVTDTLMEAVANSCPAIKWHAVVGLGNYDGDTRVIDALIYALDDPTMYIREAAIESLGKVRARKAVQYLVGALQDSHFAIRLKAVGALENIGGEQALSFLKRSADNEMDPFIKNEAAAAVRRLAARKGA